MEFRLGLARHFAWTHKKTALMNRIVKKLRFKLILPTAELSTNSAVTHGNGDGLQETCSVSCL